MVRIFASGCFDIIHGGHIRFLQEARALGDELIVCVASDETLYECKGRLSAMPTAHKIAILKELRCVNRVVIGSKSDIPGIDFKVHFERFKPDIFAITEDDQYVKAKKELCAEFDCQYVMLPKDLDYPPISTTEIRTKLAAPFLAPLRVNFAGAWLDVPKLARPDGFICNCTISPLVSLGNWPYEIGGGLGGSAAHSLLKGEDAVASEFLLGVGWQDPAVIIETGLCIWRSGSAPYLVHRDGGEWLKGLLAIWNVGKTHNTPSLVNLDRNYQLIVSASRMAAHAIRLQDIKGLGIAMTTNHAAQIQEGDDPLEPHGVGFLMCGGGHGGYGVYLFKNQTQRDAFVVEHVEATAVEPYDRWE